MIDDAHRREVALLLRRLGSGRLPAPEYEDRYYDRDIIDASDRGLQARWSKRVAAGPLAMMQRLSNEPQH